jgi:hypothetical protein
MAIATHAIRETVPGVDMLMEIYSIDGVRLLLRATKVGAIAANTGKTAEKSKTAQAARKSRYGMTSVCNGLAVIPVDWRFRERQ